VGSLIKKTSYDSQEEPKKKSEKIINSSRELLVHVDLHSSKESSNGGNFLLVLLDEPKRQKEANKPQNILEWTRLSRHNMKK
jgi:hypothetical protein